MHTNAVPVSPSEPPLTRIQPAGRRVALNLGDLWDYRELLYFLTWRDLKVRYKQTLLGAAWAVIQPFFTMLIFSLFFGRLAKIPSDNVPYPLFCYTALVPWTFFASGLLQSANSLVGNTNLLKKVFFPRLTIPIASVAAMVVDFACAFVVLLGLMAFYGVWPSVNVVWLPAFILLAFCTSLGVGLWLSALNVQFRDVKYLVPFLVQFWMFATPIAYPTSLLSPEWRTLYGLNPMVGVVDGFRWALLGSASPDVTVVASTGMALVLLLSGAYFFRQTERTFADIA
ncbi:MAG: ABC transporter permease [Vicinamibacterales bacterium]